MGFAEPFERGCRITSGEDVQRHERSALLVTEVTDYRQKIYELRTPSGTRQQRERIKRDAPGMQTSVSEHRTTALTNPLLTAWHRGSTIRVITAERVDRDRMARHTVAYIS